MDPNMLLLAAIEGEHELLMLLDQTNGQEDLSRKWRLNFDSLDDKECMLMFRFHKLDVVRLKNALGFPDTIICYNGTLASGLEALCILLRRLAYPNRLVDLLPVFGRSKEELSMICNEALSHVYDNYGHLLRQLNHNWLRQDTFQIFADAIHQKGAPLTNCFGFIDGTTRPIARPSRYQEQVFSGHKCVHALKFQSIQVPNGLIVNMYGPIEGRRHDAAMLAESGILQQLEEFVDERGQPFYVYGDPAYPLRPQLMGPFKGAHLTPQEEEFNKKMSKIRECVEWGFGDIVCQFAFVDFKKNLKLFLQPVAKYYLVATLLTNCRTCLYGNQTSQYFGVDPPELEAYLHDLM